MVNLGLGYDFMHAHFYEMVSKTMHVMQRTLKNKPLEDHFHENLLLAKCVVYMDSIWRLFQGRSYNGHYNHSLD